MSDGLSTLYQDLLSGSYDCVDRIVLNAYFRMGHDPGGFRLWWRQLTGSDATLDNAHMMRLAGRFGRRIRGYAKANDIPVVNCSAGERKHDIAEDYLARTTITQGLFLVLVGRAQAPVWDVTANHHIEKKKPMPYVNHYSFHILDAEWGHITIKKRPPSFPRANHAERPRVCRLPGPQGRNYFYQARQLLYQCLSRCSLGENRRDLV
jgi:hypothetical protein